MYFDKVFKIMIEHTIGKQLDDFKSTISLENDRELYNTIYGNAIEIAKQITFECLIENYHNLRISGVLKGKSRDERVIHFEKLFDLQKFYIDFPTLQPLLEKRLIDYINYMNEIIYNYEEDFSILCTDLGVDLGKIKNISYAAGDLHNGKSVSIISFENGKLVYKPHSLKTDLFLNKIVSFANHYLEKKIVTPKVLSKDNYGWQEFIIYQECENFNQIKSFYYRIGIYLGVFYILSSTDMHHENLIACGENPIFFDTETISSGSNTDPNLNYRMLSDSVIQTAVLPEFNKDVYEVNFSAIFTGIISPEKVETIVLDLDEKNDFIYKKHFRTMDDTKFNVPKLNGEEFEAKFVVENIIKGFKDFLLIIKDNKDDFLPVILDPFFDNMRLRQIIRPTKVYFNFLQSSLNPDIACSFEKRNQLFDLLISNFTPNQKNGYLRVQREVNDLKEGNISEFYTEYNNNILFSNGDIICSNYYLKTPKETVVNKINTLNEKTILFQVRLIYMSLQSIYGFKDLKNKCEVDNMKFLNSFSLEELITKYAEHVFDNVVPCGNDLYSFITIYPDGNFLKIKYAEPGLYHMGGLVWFLAMYSYHYDNSKINITRGLLDLFIFQYFHKKNEKIDMNNFSVFDGDGGLLYLTYNFSKAFNEKKYYNNYLEIKNDIINYYLKKDIFDKIDLDYISGLSGIIYLISKIEIDIFKIKQMPKHEIGDFRELSIKYCKYLEQCDFEKLPIGVAHGSSGVLLSLLSLYQLFEENNYLILIGKILKTQKEKLRKEHLNFSWCKGYMGILLTHILLKDANLPINNINSLLDADIDFINGYSSENYFENMNASLCHGKAGIYEIYNFFKWKGYHSPFTISPINFSNQIEEGEWFNSTKCELDSFMLGSSGVAYSLLEQIKKIPTFLTLDCFEY